MKLIGRYRSPFVRRAGVVMKALGLIFDTESLTTTDDAEKIRKYNPVGRVPSLILDSGETLVDSQTIIDYALEIGDPDSRLLPKSGPNRRSVLTISAIAQGAMEKAVASAYERNRRPKDKVFQGWVDHVDGQVSSALAALETYAAVRERMAARRSYDRGRYQYRRRLRPSVHGRAVSLRKRALSGLGCPIGTV